MKYIIFECGGSVLPILFPDYVDHAMIAQCVQTPFPGYEAKSAGFCTHKGNVWGESVSLKVESRQGDDFYIKQTLGIL